MNNHLCQVTQEQAYEAIYAKYPEAGNIIRPEYLEYWAYPQSFGSTSGPFGGVGGQAFTTFTIEAWVDEYFACLFCMGKIVKVTNEWKGPQTVRV